MKKKSMWLSILLLAGVALAAAMRPTKVLNLVKKIPTVGDWVSDNSENN